MHMMWSIALLVASALLPSALPVDAAAADPTRSKMLTALETVSADEIKTDVAFIASDEMAGRDTPSEGLRTAARFIRSRLERLGWKPGAKDGYFYEYPLDHRIPDEAKSKVSWSTKDATGELTFGVDYCFAGTRDVADLTTSAAVVFAGDGSKEDLGSSRCEGKWALVFDAGTDFSTLTRNARRAKAKGLIVAPGPNQEGGEYSTRFAAALERQRHGSASWPSKTSAKNAEDEDRPREVFPTILLTRTSIEALLAGAQKPATPAKGVDLGITLADTRALAGEGGTIRVENVMGFWPGSHPERSKECIILSAHYDHIGVINGQVHNGADDNGSGTCLMLAVAEALTQHGPLERSVMIIWVSGEEKGLWGSKAFAENPWFPPGVKPVADINIDMVGRNAPDKLLVTPTKERAKEYNELVKIAEKLAPLEGFPKLGSADKYYERSDHYEFAKLGIPVMFLFSDVHEDYHQAGDDPEKLDYDKIHRVARLVLRILDATEKERTLR